MHILRFGVGNFACFRDYSELSFISTSHKDQPNFRIRHPDFRDQILPVLGVYGANASGKTKLLEALKVVRYLVQKSFFFQPTVGVPWTPWRLDRTVDQPTRFDLDLLLDGVRYHYGFCHDDESFREEWLYRWPNNRRQVLFDRNERDEEPWYFGPSLEGEKAALAKWTRPNSLFLSTAAQHNHELLGRIYEAIVEQIRLERPVELHGYPLFSEEDPILDPKRRELVTTIIQAFDVGCAGFEFEEISSQELQPGKELEELLKPEALQKFRDGINERSRLKYFELRLLRKGGDGEVWNLPPSQESRGTHILLQRINDLLSVDSGLLVIDELETSLHPEVCSAIVKLFTSEAGNDRRVQLLFSTHNRDLLRHLRRDEAVFVEKEPDGATKISTAADYKGLRGRDDLRQVYELGRVGAVPILRDLSALLEQSHGVDA